MANTTTNKKVVTALNKLQTQTTKFMAEIEKQINKAAEGKTVTAGRLQRFESGIYGATSAVANQVCDA